MNDDEQRFDKEGNPVVLVDGQWLQKPVRKETSGFTYYDTTNSPGACGLCGRWTCNGSCFK